MLPFTSFHSQSHASLATTSICVCDLFLFDILPSLTCSHSHPSIHRSVRRSLQRAAEASPRCAGQGAADCLFLSKNRLYVCCCCCVCVGRVCVCVLLLIVCRACVCVCVLLLSVCVVCVCVMCVCVVVDRVSCVCFFLTEACAARYKERLTSPRGGPFACSHSHPSIHRACAARYKERLKLGLTRMCAACVCGVCCC